MSDIEFFYLVALTESSNDRAVKASEMVFRSGLSRRQCYNKLAKLVLQGLVRKIDGGYYQVNLNSSFVFLIWEMFEESRKDYFNGQE